jgi:predicted MPP superfamily phosphohydrolase
MPSLSREISIMMFRIGIPTLIIGIQLLLYIKFRNYLRERHPTRHWLRRLNAVLFIIMNIALLYVAIVRPRPSEMPQSLLYGAVYPFFIWHGSTLFIGVVLLIGYLLKSPFTILSTLLKRITPVRARVETVQATREYQTFDASRRVFIRRSMYGLTAASFAASAYGMFIEKKQYELTGARFRIKNLPPQLEGFTIALLSDIHSSINMTKAEMLKYVQVVNSMQCDLVLVTGDFVNSLTEEVYPFAEAFSELHAPHGVFGVMGNHDFFAPDPELVAKEVDACGVKLLRNDKVVISKNGASFYLFGVDDARGPEQAAKRIAVAAGHSPLNIPRLLMIHRPYFLQQAADAKMDLVFSGHTHGGQVVLAQFGRVTIAPASLASRYIWGKYAIGDTQMYVNRGIGTVGLPIRLNCPPEITKVTLTRA